MTYLFILLILFFTEKKFLTLTKSTCQEIFSLFSSRSLIDLYFTFKSMIHFELIFIQGMKYLSGLLFLFSGIWIPNDSTT